ncbi:MgtC/SapB family protein, partial [Rhizobiaceae sp. 2RAB30]
MDIEIFERLGLAIAIGAVVGVERHWRERDEAAGRRTAGLRTFTLIGMLGGVTGL